MGADGRRHQGAGGVMASTQKSISDSSKLSKPASTVWSRLKDLDHETLGSRKKTALKVGYSVRRSNEILGELAEKGYVRFEPGEGNFSPTRVVPIRPRAEEQSPTGEVEKSAHGREQEKPPSDDVPPVGDCSFARGRKQNNDSAPRENPLAVQPPTQEAVPKPPPEKAQQAQAASRPDFSTPAPENLGNESSPMVEKIRGGSGGGSLKDLDLLKDPVIEVKDPVKPDSLPKGVYDARAGKNPSTPTGKNPPASVDLKKTVLKAEASKQKRSRQIKASRERKKNQPPPATGTALARELEQDASLPNATFSPGPKERRRMVEILSRQPGDPERRQLAGKLSMEFRRIYTRYRRQLQDGYECIPSEHRFAERAASLCVMREVKPSDLIGYWSEHVGDFTNMQYPPLSFLSSPGNVDRVACLRSTSTTRTSSTSGCGLGCWRLAST